VTPKLVSTLCKEAIQHPEKLVARRQLKQLQDEKKDAIEDVTISILSANIPIVRAQQVQLAVEEQRGLEVSMELVRHVFRKDLHLGYRFAKGVPV